ncbi:MAG: hypothetical protein A2342_00965 [Gallionellales bacterium RIFOXYB12_FULL_54_9]|nr:MAG: hypothetical protein A2342_00965 [Gallionellales bacterium RIFOXYB12_FULL_54_9]
MKRIELNLYTGRARRHSVVGWALLILGLIVVVGLIVQHNKLKTEQQKMTALLMQQHDRQHPSVSPGDTKALGDQLQRAAEVIEQLAFPWEPLFRTLESNSAEDVVLLSIQPDIKGGVITINAEARDWPAMLAYIRQLGADQFFTDVHLVSHQIEQTDPQKPIRFVLLCSRAGDVK